MAGQQKVMIAAWLALFILSGASIAVGHSYINALPRLALAGGLLFLSFMKASLVLAFYLELRRAPRWNRALRLAVGLLLLGIFVISAFR